MSEVLSGCAVRAAIQKFEDKSQAEPTHVPMAEPPSASASSRNICYCGEYGGGRHTRSARCVKPEQERYVPREWSETEGVTDTHGTSDEELHEVLTTGEVCARLNADERRAIRERDEMRALLQEIYDADRQTVAEMKAMGLAIDDVIDPKFQHRIEDVLGLPSTRKPQT